MEYKMPHEVWDAFKDSMDHDETMHPLELEHILEDEWGLRCDNPAISYCYEIVDEKKATMFLLRWT